MKGYVSTSEAAERLGVCLNTVINMADSGNIEYQRPNPRGKRYISEAAIDAILQKSPPKKNLTDGLKPVSFTAVKLDGQKGFNYIGTILIEDNSDLMIYDDEELRDNLKRIGTPETEINTIMKGMQAPKLYEEINGKLVPVKDLVKRYNVN